MHDWLTGMRGGEKVLEQLCALWPDAVIHTLFHFEGSTSQRIARHQIKSSWLQHLPLTRSRYRSYLPLFSGAIERFDLSDFDLVISSSHCVAKGAIKAPTACHVCYCHTPVRYAWDQQHAYFPNRSGVTGRARDLVLSRLRRWDVESSLRVDRFVANSTFVAERIRRYYARRADVVAPPVDVEFYSPPSEPESAARGSYCLSVAALAPYKKIDVAIEACARLDRRLVLVGQGTERLRLEQLAAARGADVQFLGHVDDRRLRDLYRGATCLVQAGIEDFGISSVEALACGTAVVARAQGGILDVVEHDRHGVLYLPDGAIDPLSDDPEQESTAAFRAREIQALAEAIDKCAGIRSNKLDSRLDRRRRAEQFSPEMFRERMRNAVSTCCDSPPAPSKFGVPACESPSAID